MLSEAMRTWLSAVREATDSSECAGYTEVARHGGMTRERSRRKGYVVSHNLGMEYTITPAGRAALNDGE